jgi:hypothetical protein
MKRLGVLLVLLLAGAAQPAWALDTLRPEQLKPGMKGHGLSVFRGTEPERFDVEVIGVLHNAFPKQDMILIKLSGANLEKHKVIAGMSGSPIYINDKLIGALAYGWSFQNDPVAGVTPIHNMLAELNSAPTGRMSATAAVPSSAPATATADFTAPRPLLTPLALGGFSPRVIALIADKLQPLGLLPIAGGGPAGMTKLPRGRIVPGGAIGVDLVRGDFNATAVGTATYVDKGKVLAFGHPFFLGGRVEAPAVQAEVHTILSSVATSFKLASAVADVGAMVGDWQSCIVADTKVTPSMIPLTVSVANRDTGQAERYEMEILRNESLSALITQFVIVESVFAASSSSQDTTVRIAVRAELADRTLELTNTFFNAQGGLLDPAGLAPLLQMFNTDFGDPTVRRIDVTVEAALTRRTAEIRRAYFSKSEVERGEHLPLHVVLKPFGRPEVTQTFTVDVPAATDSMRWLTVTVVAGGDAPADVAPPETLDDFLDALQKQHRTTDLVALIQSPTQGLQYRGKLLKNLPASVRVVLDDSSNAGVINAADMQQLVLPTDWVLSGLATVRVPIRQE